MRREGYHRIVLPSGEVIEGPLVVELDAMGNVVSWHPLFCEEAMVVWVGGTLYL